jgi:hypothetical protein
MSTSRTVLHPSPALRAHFSEPRSPTHSIEQLSLPAILDAKIEQAAAYAQAARSVATRRAYESDWAIFTAWCAAHQLSALPASPDVVAVFAADQATAGLNPATIGRRVAAR